MNETKLAVIGSGQMGQALVRSFIKEFMNPEQIYLYDIDEQKAIKAASEIGCKTIDSSDTGILKDCQAILLAVKPQVIKNAISEIVSLIDERALVISIAAGVSLKLLRSYGLKNNPLARVMPNTPALVGAAVSGIAYDNIGDNQKKWVTALFSSSGLAIEVPEDQLDAITGMSGSGPAYMMMIIEAMADAGVRQGLSRDQSIQIAAMTMYGSAKLVIESGMHPAQLKDQVCSPGGTTIAAVASLEKNGLRNAMIEAVAAAAEKSKMLAKSGENI